MKNKILGGLMCLALLCSLLATPALARPVKPPPTPMDYDVIIINGTVIDGSGTAGYQADIAVKDGKIVAILPHLMPPGLDKANPPGLDKANPPGLDRAAKVIDATGMVVAPGFIDIHTHQAGPISNTTSLNFIKDGVTTTIGGNCGSGSYPVS